MTRVNMSHPGGEVRRAPPGLLGAWCLVLGDSGGGGVWPRLCVARQQTSISPLPGLTSSQLDP